MTQPACIRLTDPDQERAGYACVACGAGEATDPEPGNDEVRAIFWRALQHQAVHDPVATNTGLRVELFEGDAVRPDEDGIVSLRHGLGTEGVFAVAFAADGSLRHVRLTSPYGDDEVEVVATPDTARIVLSVAELSPEDAARALPG